jgi:glutamyl-tRNA synthetase
MAAVESVKESNIRVRIAPSPTGKLHIGTARTAVFNWLFARHHQGTFVLRIEDTDIERSRPEYTENIREGLTWLGLNWDEGPFYQTDRMDLYRQAIETLLKNGSAYYCFCTEDELEAMRAEQEATGQAPRYDNRHRNLTTEQQQAFVAEGRLPVVRFRIEDDRTITWNDQVRDQVSWAGTDLGGDMVIARRAPFGEIGQPLYNFVVVVDDVDMKITHIIRGEDHVANTAKQILLYEALGAEVPLFAHTPLILSPSGKKLSKRDGVTSIEDFRKMGYLPEAMVNYMTLLGWSPPDAEERFTLTQAAEKFGFERVNKAGAKFDWDKLNWLNSQYIHEMPIDRLTDLLLPLWHEAGYEFDPGDRSWLEKLTALVAPSLVKLNDAVEMSRYLFVPTIEYSEEAIAQLKQEGVAGVLQAMLDVLEDAPLDEAGAQELIQQVVKAAGVKKGVVMRSLRAALTCDMHGPDLLQSWLLLHRHKLDRSRLEQAQAHI